MNRRVPNGTHGGVRGRKSPLETLSYSITESEGFAPGQSPCHAGSLANAPPEHLRPEGTFAFESLYAKKEPQKWFLF
jgi:hypothetical protein